MGLMADNRDPAYLSGRLFAVLESIQMDANPGINATIRDRYFNSACAAPASVFPVLIKLKNSHMKKLEREKGSSKRYYEQVLTAIMGIWKSSPGACPWRNREGLFWGIITRCRSGLKKGRINK